MWHHNIKEEAEMISLRYCSDMDTASVQTCQKFLNVLVICDDSIVYHNKLYTQKRYPLDTIRMCVCMCVWMDGWMDGWVDGWIATSLRWSLA